MLDLIRSGQFKQRLALPRRVKIDYKIGAHMRVRAPPSVCSGQKQEKTHPKFIFNNLRSSILSENAPDPNIHMYGRSDKLTLYLEKLCYRRSQNFTKYRRTHRFVELLLQRIRGHNKQRIGSPLVGGCGLDSRRPKIKTLKVVPTAAHVRCAKQGQLSKYRTQLGLLYKPNKVSHLTVLGALLCTDAFTHML